MKRLLALVGFCLMSSGLVWAQPEVSVPASAPATGTAVALAPEGAVGNNPSGAWQLWTNNVWPTATGLLGYFNPSYDGIIV